MVHRGLGWRRDVRHNDASTSLWIFLLAVRLLQTVKKGESVLLRKPPTLAARTMCLSFGNVKTKLRINAFYGEVHIPCSASAATKKCAPLRGFAFFCCAKPLQCKMRVEPARSRGRRDVRHKDTPTQRGISFLAEYLLTNCGGGEGIRKERNARRNSEDVR